MRGDKKSGECLNMKVLNIGCGFKSIPGIINIDHKSGVGVDVIAKLDKLPYETNCVDIILASHVLEHLSNLPEVLEEIYRVLKPGGILAAWIPYGWKHAENPYHLHVWTEKTVKILTRSKEGITDLDRLYVNWKLISLEITQFKYGWHLKNWFNMKGIGKDEMRFIMEAIK